MKSLIISQIFFTLDLQLSSSLFRVAKQKSARRVFLSARLSREDEWARWETRLLLRGRTTRTIAESQAPFRHLSGTDCKISVSWLQLRSLRSHTMTFLHFSPFFQISGGGFQTNLFPVCLRDLSTQLKSLRYMTQYCTRWFTFSQTVFAGERLL